MANVHTLNDLNRGGGGGGGGYPGGGGYMAMGGQEPGPPLDPEAMDALSMFQGLQGGGGQQSKPPREENFWDMWKFTFCANFTPNAIPAIVFYINTVVYIAAIIWSNIQYGKLNNNVFLGPELALLNEWGAKNPFLIRYQYQYWRLLTPVFLTVDFN